MSKLGAVLIVIAIMIALNLVLLVVMPVLVEFATTANTTITAAQDLTLYPGASEGLIASPWVLYFAPNVIGMIVIVIILKTHR